MVTSRHLVVSLGLASACFAQHAGRPCADVPIKTTDGKTIHIAQYHGKVAVIVLYSTICDHCLDTLQFMSRLENEMGPRGLQIVAVSLDDNPANVAPFAERYRFPFPMGHLTPKQAIKFLDLNPTARPIVPYLMFVDWMGNVRFQHAGNDPIFNSEETNIRAIADGLLRQAAEKKGPQLETRPAAK